MFTRATALMIDETQKRQLESWARAGTTPQRVARKCQAILLAGQGMSNHSIAQQTGLSRPTVLATRAAFSLGGCATLRQAQKRQRSRRVLTAELEQQILETTLKTRPADATPWSVRELARQLRVSRMMVHRVWQRYDVQPHRVQKFKISNDPQFEEKVRDVVGLYVHHPDRALVLCVDEKSQIQALDRTAPILPLRPGLPERQTHDYKRHGTTTLFAAFNILNGKVMGCCLPVIAVGSLSSSSPNGKRQCRRIWRFTSLWTTTAPTRALRWCVGSNLKSAFASTFTSPPPAAPGLIR